MDLTQMLLQPFDRVTVEIHFNYRAINWAAAWQGEAFTVRWCHCEGGARWLWKQECKHRRLKWFIWFCLKARMPAATSWNKPPEHKHTPLYTKPSLCPRFCCSISPSVSFMALVFLMCCTSLSQAPQTSSFSTSPALILLFQINSTSSQESK